MQDRTLSLIRIDMQTFIAYLQDRRKTQLECNDLNNAQMTNEVIVTCKSWLTDIQTLEEINNIKSTLNLN